MDITSYYYFSELAKDLNMSRTAERIYVSQQTISNHIQRLEEHFGTKLFYRKPSLSLTYAGECALQFAQRLLREQQNLEDFLGDVEKHGKGLLHFGASPLRLNDSLPMILPRFSALYPMVRLQITSAMSARLEPMIEEGKLDLAIVLGGSATDPSLEEELLGEDPVYLCLPDNLLEGEEGQVWKEKALTGVEVTDCARFPLCMTENRMGEEIMQIFRAEGIDPQVYLSSSDSNLIFMVCCTGVAAAFVGHNRLVNAKNNLPENLNIFPLLIRGKPAQQRLFLIHRKDRYLPSYAAYFSELLKECFGEMEKIRMERRV